MRSVTLKAHFDGEHIVLDEPFEIPENSRLEVRVVSAEAQGNLEHDNWSLFSAENLARAYSNDEPEYTLADVKS